MPDIWMDVDTALAEVPVNKVPLVDDTDFKTREESVAYNAAGMDLVWNFVTSAGAMTQTAVTPTTAGDYDWTNQGNGMYSIEIPASGGASINNDTEGYGWFTGFVTGVLPWSGPVIGFRAAALNDAMCDGGDLLDVNVTQVGGSTQDIATATALATVDSNVDAILVDTAEIGAAGAGLTALPWNAAWDAEVQSECTDALNAYDPPTKTEMDSAFTEVKGATWSSSTDTLEAIRNRGDAAWVTATGFSTLDAAGVRTAVGLGSANLDTQLADLPTVAEFEARTIAAASYFDPATDRVLLDKADALRVTGSVNDGSASTTVFVTDLTEATDDHYIGRTIIFTSGALTGQASDITDYNGTTKAITVTALTEAPANAVTFEIV